uniref:WGS project CAEQ00000000 data, annotated contig 1004 n=1 Tax=Trypanosoma congolense (strain IL3000) TaxID=1068625 RepID=F9W360_TRYCI|nr:unnamed protein product [Trypanosoma congolense IL3000]
MCQRLGSPIYLGTQSSLCFVSFSPWWRGGTVWTCWVLTLWWQGGINSFAALDTHCPSGKVVWSVLLMDGTVNPACGSSAGINNFGTIGPTGQGGDQCGWVDPEMLSGVPCGNGAVKSIAAAPSGRNFAEEPKGVCPFPPLSRVSFMLRGDNGVIRWITASGMDQVRESRAGQEGVGDEQQNCMSEEDEELEKERAAAIDLRRRVAKTGLGFVDIAALKQQILDEEAEASANKNNKNEQKQAQGNAQHPAMSGDGTLWSMKYSPQRFRDLLSDDATNLKLLRWMKSWDEYVFREEPSEGAGASSPAAPPDDRLAILIGPPGVGKTTLAHVLAMHCGYEPLEINASVDRTASKIENAIQLAIAPGGGRRRKQRSISATSSSRAVTGDAGAAASGGNSGKNPAAPKSSLTDMLMVPRCLIIDEVDGATDNVAAFLLKQDIHRPVLCLCNEKNQAVRQLLKRCGMVLYIDPIRPQRLLSRLREITELEGIKVDDAILADLVRSSNGDVRCCLNTLQFAYQQILTSGAQHSHNQQQELLHGALVKDTKLSPRDTWLTVFERRERAKYIQCLRKEFSMNYEAVVMAGCRHSPSSVGLSDQQQQTLGDDSEEGYVAAGFRVDPGHIYVSRILQQCSDVREVLSAIQEFYLQRSYTDYSLRNTRGMADAFSFHDCLTSAAYRHNPLLPFVDSYAQSATASLCFNLCSSMSRASSTASRGFPREAREADYRASEALHISRMIRDGCRSLEVAAHLYSTASTLDFAPLLLRCLCDVSLHVPSHSLSSAVGLSQKDKQLLHATVARHALYGLTYARVPVGRQNGNAWNKEETRNDDEQEELWELTPPIHHICCTTLNSLRGAHNLSQKNRHDGASLSIMALCMKEEVKQLLVGEIQRHVIQNTASRAARGGVKIINGSARSNGKGGDVSHNTTKLQSRKREREEDEKGVFVKVKTEEGVEVPRGPGVGAEHGVGPESHAQLKPAAVSEPDLKKPTSAKGGSANPTTSSLTEPSRPRDLFGRPIVAGSLGGKLSVGKGGRGAASGGSGAGDAPARKLAVQYIYREGCTNAVKIPATFEDF